MTSPLELYGEDLLSARSGASGLTWLRDDDGGTYVLDLPRWVAPAGGADDALLDRCSGPTLDLGCGPGRLTRALVARGLECLGVDVAPVAVALARHGGTPVLHASAFDAVLDGTRWSTILLADGNIGIGGDPVALLARCRALLAGRGRILVELGPPGSATRTVRVRVESSSGRSSSWFPWAHVGAGDIGTAAGAAGLAVARVWHCAGRWFAELDTGVGEGEAGMPERAA
ncbi:MAG TPA: class I SAM-dependent methyltransferase [Mycobacteriales bacterium]|jgi:SAM-dependent methyltransferase|nr:class I SAM-dependent methyltransferase [Mycobacteriales bacterium]